MTLELYVSACCVFCCTAGTLLQWGANQLRKVKCGRSQAEQCDSALASWGLMQKGACPRVVAALLPPPRLVMRGVERRYRSRVLLQRAKCSSFSLERAPKPARATHLRFTGE